MYAEHYNAGSKIDIFPPEGFYPMDINWLIAAIEWSIVTWKMPERLLIPNLHKTLLRESAFL